MSECLATPHRQTTRGVVGDGVYPHNLPALVDVEEPPESNKVPVSPHVTMKRWFEELKVVAGGEVPPMTLINWWLLCATLAQGAEQVYRLNPEIFGGQDPSEWGWKQYLELRANEGIRTNYTVFSPTPPECAQTETDPVKKQLEVAARVLHALERHHDDLRSEQPPVATQRIRRSPVLTELVPLDMRQHREFFGSYTTPSDRQLLVVPGEIRGPRYAVVMIEGCAYRLELGKADGNGSSIGQLMQRLVRIREYHDRHSGEIGDHERSIAAMSGAPVKQWGILHRMLMSGESSARTLLTLEQATMILCLDSLPDPSDESPTGRLERYRTGGEDNWRNRFPAKNLVIVGTGGRDFGFLLNHHLIDGSVAGELLKVVRDQLTTQSSHGEPSRTEVPEAPVFPLRFGQPAGKALHALLQAVLTRHRIVRNQVTESLALAYTGAEACKQLGASPDAVLQIALLMASRVLSEDGAELSAVTTVNTRCRGGRIELIVPTTPAVREFIEALEQVRTVLSGGDITGAMEANKNRLQKLLVLAATSISDKVDSARTGKGVYTNLMAMSAAVFGGLGLGTFGQSLENMLAHFDRVLRRTLKPEVVISSSIVPEGGGFSTVPAAGTPNRRSGRSNFAIGYSLKSDHVILTITGEGAKGTPKYLASYDKELREILKLISRILPEQETVL